MVWGLASSYQPFLRVVRPGFVQALNWLATLPNGFLEMVGGRRHIVKCASQQEVLAHPTTEGFWTHNGWNSMLVNICEGVSMLCQPNFGDQMLNAMYMTDI